MLGCLKTSKNRGKRTTARGLGGGGKKEQGRISSENPTKKNNAVKSTGRWEGPGGKTKEV